ncbi:MAG: hypothetical protein R3E93_01490 [Thiothrix sp.]
MNLTALKERASLYQQVRVFFGQRNVLEVETPALSQAGNAALSSTVSASTPPTACVGCTPRPNTR